MFHVVNGLGQDTAFATYKAAHTELWAQRQYTWANLITPSGRTVR